MRSSSPPPPAAHFTCRPQRIKEIGRPVTLIVDNLKVHHAKVMGDWLAVKKEKCGFTLEYLPSHSPELNPDEYLN